MLIWRLFIDHISTVGRCRKGHYSRLTVSPPFSVLVTMDIEIQVEVEVKGDEGVRGGRTEYSTSAPDR